MCVCVCYKCLHRPNILSLIQLNVRHIYIYTHTHTHTNLQLLNIEVDFTLLYVARCVTSVVQSNCGVSFFSIISD